MNSYQITAWCSHFISNHVRQGDLCIDATMGNGNDTELLCRLVGETGHVHAFDIQKMALEHTRKDWNHPAFCLAAHFIRSPIHRWISTAILKVCAVSCLILAICPAQTTRSVPSPTQASLQSRQVFVFYKKTV